MHHLLPAQPSNDQSFPDIQPDERGNRFSFSSSGMGRQLKAWLGSAEQCRRPSLIPRLNPNSRPKRCSLMAPKACQMSHYR